MEPNQEWQELVSELFEKHYRSLRNYALSLTHNEDDADDLLHDAYLRLVEHAQNYDARRSFTAYAKRAIHNIYVSNYVPRRHKEIPLSAFTDSYHKIAAPAEAEAVSPHKISIDICTQSERELIRKNCVSDSLAQRLRIRYEMQFVPITDALRHGRMYYDFVYASLQDLLQAIHEPCHLSSVAREIVQLIHGHGTWIVRCTLADGKLIVHDAPLVYGLAILHKAKYPLPCGRADRVPCVVLVKEREPANG